VRLEVAVVALHRVDDLIALAVLAQQLAPSSRWVPSISRSTALPMSWSSPALPATLALTPSSPAMWWASHDTSSECLSAFWP